MLKPQQHTKWEACIVISVGVEASGHTKYLTFWVRVELAASSPLLTALVLPQEPNYQGDGDKEGESLDDFDQSWT